jgi:hypothetical protein
VVVEAVRRVHPVPGVVVRLEFVGLDEQPIHATRDTATRIGDESERGGGSIHDWCFGE